MSKEDIDELRRLFFDAGFLVGETSEKDIMFKYTVPIYVESVLSLTIFNPHSENKTLAVVNPSGVAYTYEYKNGIEDNISEVPYDGSIEGLFTALKLLL